MSTGLRTDLDTASVLALELVAHLTGSVDRVEIAGSIRRQQPDVGDIELVAIPTIETEPDGMFGERQVNRLTVRIDDLIVTGILAPHPEDPKRGDRYSKVVHRESGLQVDIFSARPETWGIIDLIRTGPASYSSRFVTDLRKRGLHAAVGELHRGSLGCGTYECELLPTPEEVDVYRLAGWPFVSPEDRT